MLDTDWLSGCDHVLKHCYFTSDISKTIKSHHICVPGESFSIILRSIFRTDVEEAGQTIFLSSVLSSVTVVSTPFSLERYHHGLN